MRIPCRDDEVSPPSNDQLNGTLHLAPCRLPANEANTGMPGSEGPEGKEGVVNGGAGVLQCAGHAIGRLTQHPGTITARPAPV